VRDSDASSPLIILIALSNLGRDPDSNSAFRSGRWVILGLSPEFHQSNDESDIINWIQSAADKHGLIINAGAYTHTSIAIHDALKSSNSPAIEVHISNIHKREEFRHKSYLSSVVDGIIVGFGDYGYELAIHALIKIIKSRT